MFSKQVAKKKKCFLIVLQNGPLLSLGTGNIILSDLIFSTKILHQMVKVSSLKGTYMGSQSE